MLDEVIRNLNEDFVQNDVGDLVETKIFNAITETLIEIGFDKMDSIKAGFSTSFDIDADTPEGDLERLGAVTATCIGSLTNHIIKRYNLPEEHHGEILKLAAQRFQVIVREPDYY